MRRKRGMARVVEKIVSCCVFQVQVWKTHLTRLCVVSRPFEREASERRLRTRGDPQISIIVCMNLYIAY